MMAAITLQDIYAARSRIAGLARRTPLVPSPSLAGRLGGEVRLKLETLQDIGAFKIRGAANRILDLSPAERGRGVVTVSTGNHGRAVASAARAAGVRAVVCLSRLVPAFKVAAIEGLGAEVRVVGDSQDEAEVEAVRLVDAEDMVYVNPYDDRHVIAGQGTIGLELLEDYPALETAIVPLSGGGLIGGIALALKAAAPRVRVIGVSMERGAAMIESLRAGRPIQVPELPTLADSLGGGIGLDNRHTFALVRDLVDATVQVSEAEIAEAMRHAYREERLIVEGGGAVGIAAVLAGRIAGVGRTGIVLSGRNLDMDLFTRIVTGDPSALPA
ncbi:MAG: hydroxyectoine utilization dehydratase EutB [Alphaproteobacteria bacterium]|nr:hydroxyectoine utilization dehydratase EutB [Alphaproteobacteria bacterium]